MDDLVGIAAQQEVTGFLQGFQHQRELHGGDVLHFVDHHEVVARCRPRLPVVGDQIEVVELRLGQPGAVFLEQSRTARRAVRLGKIDWRTPSAR